MKRSILISAVLTLALLASAATDAQAVLVRTPSGHLLGVTPKAGITPTAVPGATVPRAATRASSNGNLDYNGGQVLHSSAPYLIFWDPSGTGISSASRSLLTQYLTDLAADSGKSTNVFAVNRQFTDGSGIADYKQTFTSAQAINDSQAFPTPDLASCPDVNSLHYPNCLTDAQLQAEITRLIKADHLPTGTGANAPIYFVVTPHDTNICFDKIDCADSITGGFCAYHGNYPVSSQQVLYGSIPLFFNGDSSAQDPKACQADGNTAPQEPNGDIADVAIKYLSHEDSETITDPTGSGWFDRASGNEDGDNCNFTGSYNPANGSNPNAFTPTLGGSASGSLYNQTINGHHYYTQSEWSNGDVNCEMQPSAGMLSPSFSTPSSIEAMTPVSFNPSASTSTHGYSSASWDFGDGATAFNAGAPATTSHTYSNNGTYTVTLTLVDGAGNVAKTTRQIQVQPTPTAAFTFTPQNPGTDNTVSFDGSGSKPATPGHALSYSWDFGDGSSPGTGVAPTHRYSSPGTYTVKLTVTEGGVSSPPASHSVVVSADDAPSANLSVRTASPQAGLPVSFDGSGSRDPDGTVTQYAWSFGDGSSGASGAGARHVFRRGGSFTIVLSVTDSSGITSHTSRVVNVATPTLTSTFKKGVLRVSTDQGGTVAVQSKRKQLQQAGTLRFKIKLSRRQRRQLRSKHHLKLKLKIKFAPLAADAVTKTVTVKVKG